MAPKKHTVAAKARELREALDLPALLAAMAITQEEADLLNALAAGTPVEGGALALAALKVKLQYTTPMPSQRIQVQGAFLVANPYTEGEFIKVTPRQPELPPAPVPALPGPAGVVVAATRKKTEDSE
jgi:hypothetical protein